MNFHSKWKLLGFFCVAFGISLHWKISFSDLEVPLLPFAFPLAFSWAQGSLPCIVLYVRNSKEVLDEVVRLTLFILLLTNRPVLML